MKLLKPIITAAVLGAATTANASDPNRTDLDGFAFGECSDVHEYASDNWKTCSQDAIEGNYSTYREYAEHIEGINPVTATRKLWEFIETIEPTQPDIVLSTTECIQTMNVFGLKESIASTLCDTLAKASSNALPEELKAALESGKTANKETEVAIPTEVRRPTLDMGEVVKPQLIEQTTRNASGIGAPVTRPALRVPEKGYVQPKDLD